MRPSVVTAAAATCVSVDEICTTAQQLTLTTSNSRSPPMFQMHAATSSNWCFKSVFDHLTEAIDDSGPSATTRCAQNAGLPLQLYALHLALL
jgi:hypothetical protein